MRKHRVRFSETRTSEAVQIVGSSSGEAVNEKGVSPEGVVVFPFDISDRSERREVVDGSSIRTKQLITARYSLGRFDDSVTVHL